MNRIVPLKTAVAALAICVISLTTLFAYANSDAPEAGGRPPSFEEMDSNNDGLLSLNEVKGKLAEDFDRFDADSDGYLSQTEMPPPPGQGPSSRDNS